MLDRIESILRPTSGVPHESPPSPELWAFYRYFLAQIPLPLVMLLTAGFLVALFDAAIPIFIGRMVSYASNFRVDGFSEGSRRLVIEVAIVVAVARPFALLLQMVAANQLMNPGLTNLVVWQSHWHIVRRSLSFFQSDYAGRIANSILQTGPALRESVVSCINAVWYIAIYSVLSVGFLLSRHWSLIVPLVVWAILYLLLLRRLVPRARAASRESASARSAVTGLIVDTYNNIQLVKVLSTEKDADDCVREAIDSYATRVRTQTRVSTTLSFSLTILNSALVLTAGAVVLFLFSQGKVQLDVFATTLSSMWLLSGASTWVAQSVATIFENVGTVHAGAMIIGTHEDLSAQRPTSTGSARGSRCADRIEFDDVYFDYNVSSPSPALNGVKLIVESGERIGLVGPSGAGKSTLINLLLGLYWPTRGRILIDGEDTRDIPADILRGHFSVVTQDTNLFHRSVRQNICFGLPGATEAMMVEAAVHADAHEFICQLIDVSGRCGYDAHIGERGVKLSGGQRQRIALARAIIRQAPILVLDEATSSLDTRSEFAIHETLDRYAHGRTMIAVAHRLSSIARMDRIIVLEKGQVCEMGSHTHLMKLDGLYSALWKFQQKLAPMKFS